MTPAARLSAAIEVLADIAERRRPAPDALKDWGLAHRFAGSKDRAAIASLVYDALRRRASAAHVMGDAGPRAILLGTLVLARGMDAAGIALLCTGERFAPEPLSAEEAARLAAPSLADAPPHVAGDFPDWLSEDLAAAFGDGLVEEMQALATRAPIDIRVNTLKAERQRLIPALAHLNPAITPHAPTGLRFAAGEDGRGPTLQATPEFIKGLFEIQDEGSQVVAALAGAAPGLQVVDLCAGGGGKTLELAALMDNSGQIYATDADARRLAPIHERLTRAGARNVQVRTPRGRGDEPLADLAGRMDLVLVDAPCTGIGTWRRNPDTKWRVRPGALDERMKEQDLVLDRAARLVKPGGRIAYITCSVIPRENDHRIAAFLEINADFEPVDPGEVLALAPDTLSERDDLVSAPGLGVQLSPLRTGTDGFYLAILQRNS
ncbi:RsmB/NOP family class I SAM-dependent RNA methyltransferase [Phreatobacter sp.]|uniref:RsmB/NOP family class I SAM-dependent RNA methyltransferase n=1 Tax=Phreatobacter sp. TaxID=1966341 RepID=UPI003F7033AA